MPPFIYTNTYTSTHTQAQANEDPTKPQLHKCYETPLAAEGFTQEAFPFCTLLEDGRSALYWKHDGM